MSVASDAIDSGQPRVAAALRLGARAWSPLRLRRLLERSGPAAIKFGQFLATRPDLVPQDYADELLGLVDQVAPFSWIQVRKVLTDDFGSAPEDMFAWINPNPLAAASLAQVHEARTSDGTAVAVKVQRPDIRARVDRDLSRGRWVVRVLEATGAIRVVSPSEVLAEFARWLNEELDFQRELVNLTRLYKLETGNPTARIPRPYPELCSQHVVTAELLRGVPFSELLRLVREGHTERIEALSFNRDQLAANLLTTLLRQMFQHRFYHGDPHPGNLVALPGSVVGFVDFGLVQTLDDDLLQSLSRYLRAIYATDIEQMYRGLMEILVTTERSDLDAFHTEFVEQTRAFMRARRVPRSTLARTPIAGYLVSVLGAARRYNVRIPAGVLSAYRTLLTGETIAGQIGASVDLETVGQRFFVRLQVRSALDAMDPERLMLLGSSVLSLLTEAPDTLNRLLRDVADDRFVLQVRTSESRDDRRQADARARLLTAAVVSVGVALLVGAVGHETIFGGPPAAVVLLPFLAMTYLVILVLWRRLT